MTVELLVSVSVPSASEADAGEVRVELLKRFEMPCAPYPGLQIRFRPLESSEDDEELREEDLESDMLADGIFTLDSVAFSLYTDEFKVTSFDRYETERDVRAIVRQLVDDYGFEVLE